MRSCAASGRGTVVGGRRDRCSACSSPTRSRGGVFRGKAVISAFMLLPLVVPTVVLRRRAARAVPAERSGAPRARSACSAVLIGHVVIALPFAVLLLLPRIASIDKRLEEAAEDLGASGFTTVPAHHPAADHAGADLVAPRRLRRLDRRGRDRELRASRIRPDLPALPVLRPASRRPRAPPDAGRDRDDRLQLRPRARSRSSSAASASVAWGSRSETAGCHPRLRLGRSRLRRRGPGLLAGRRTRRRRPRRSSRLGRRRRAVRRAARVSRAARARTCRTAPTCRAPARPPYARRIGSIRGRSRRRRAISRLALRTAHGAP